MPDTAPLVETLSAAKIDVGYLLPVAAVVDIKDLEVV